MATTLIDSYHRRIDYLRVSVTDRCDLRCTYCLPDGFNDFEEPAKWLSHAEMARLIGLFVMLGVAKVRLTGGEPLLRRGLIDLVQRIAPLPGLRDLSLSTNGTQLARHAQALKSAGVTRLNVSLDSLNPDCFAHITGRDGLHQVIAGLAEAKAAGFAPIKLNMVVLAGQNLDQIEPMAEFALREGFVLRLIEPMPLGQTGQRMPLIDLTRLGESLAARFGLLPRIMSHGAGPARYWADPTGSASIGVITPLSQHFCEGCNRVRLTVDGTLLLCLGQEASVELGPMLRAGASDAELVAAIQSGIARKPERHEFNEAPQKIVRFMAQTGG
ncbi:MAG: GTP 3',8-cyclase MoaA [Formivibrio sp.]|nr:GTP 3',8-cyclase MoaA [Formivibrio sp.]